MTPTTTSGWRAYQAGSFAVVTLDLHDYLPQPVTFLGDPAPAPPDHGPLSTVPVEVMEKIYLMECSASPRGGSSWTTKMSDFHRSCVTRGPFPSSRHPPSPSYTHKVSLCPTPGIPQSSIGVTRNAHVMG